MNCKLFSTLSFVAGAAIGSLVTWKFVKTKYERIAQEEIDSVKEVYSKKKASENEQNKPITVTTPLEKPDIMEYAATIKRLGYATDSDEEEVNPDEDYEGEGGDDAMVDAEIYVISSDEFDELEDYDVETLTYYADGVLTDWYNDPIGHPDEYVGAGTLEKFDELADGDTVFVRNEIRQCDYEIQRDLNKYADVFPPEAED